MVVDKEQRQIWDNAFHVKEMKKILQDHEKRIKKLENQNGIKKKNG